MHFDSLQWGFRLQPGVPVPEQLEGEGSELDPGRVRACPHPQRPARTHLTHTLGLCGQAAAEVTEQRQLVTAHF